MDRMSAAETKPGLAGAAQVASIGGDWKQQALEEFRQWLDSMTASSPAPEQEQEQGTAPCDLRDLFAELAALRQEVRLQNREQSRAGRELASAAARYDAIDRVLERRDEELAAFEDRVSRAAENRCLLPVLDLRDALVRGRDAAVGLRKAGTKGRKGRRKGARKLLRRMQPGIAGVIEGYELAIRRCDRMLAQFGVHAVPTVAARFDARTMHAVDTRQVKQQAEGVVVEEYVSGFVRDGAVLRLAEVAVNRLRGAG
jgi:molecular chaperone GrpE (heat shock protein)